MSNYLAKVYLVRDRKYGRILETRYGPDKQVFMYKVRLNDGSGIRFCAPKAVEILDQEALVDYPYFDDDDLFYDGASTNKQAWVKPTRLCSHAMTEVELTEGMAVYLSSSSAQRNRQGVPPSAGLYLASSWLDKGKGTVLMQGSGYRDNNAWPLCSVDWPDFGVIPVHDLHQAVLWAMKAIQAGHRLEIGCIGGHGRTGTMTCAIMVYLGWTPNDAIAHLRKVYCKKVVERKCQEDLLKEYGKRLKGVRD